MDKFLKLENENLSVLIDRSFGGKIVSLKNNRSSYEWVWFDGEKYSNFSPENFSDYDSQWLGGYEELFPNDKIENLNGLNAPDHGELWSSPWEVVNKNKTEIELYNTGYYSKAKVSKKYTLSINKIRVDYCIENITFDKFLFKLHLAMPINKTNIKFEFKDYRVVDEKFGNIILPDGIDSFLNEISPNEGKNDFAYFYGNDGFIKIQNGKENIINLKYDKTTLPYLWIFQTRGGWNNLNVNVIEPCNAGVKDLEESVKRNLLYLPEKRTYKTWYEMEI